jgi:RNA polymerase sigma factor (sigma-70 family)
MRSIADSYLFPGAFAPILSLDQLCAGFDEETGTASFDLTDPEPLADERLIREQAMQAVNAFVASLPPRDQEIVQRVFWDEESQTDIAARFGISKMAISKAMARIYERGRAALITHVHRPPMH